MPYEEVYHWYCEKCEHFLTTHLKFFRKKCSECGRYMETLTEFELNYHRKRLRRMLGVK